MEPDEQQVEEQTEQQTDAQADQASDAQNAAFLAGFEDRPTATPAEPEKTAEEDAAQATPAAEAPPAEEFARIPLKEWQETQARLARITEIDEIKAQQDKAFGHIGGLQRQVNARQKLTMPKDRLDALRYDLPELVELIENIEVAATPDPVDPAAILKQAEALITRAVEAERKTQQEQQELRWIRHADKAISKEHADWRDVAKSPEFHAHIKAKGDAYAQEVFQAAEEWNYLTVSDALTDFKEAQKRATDSKSARQNRLASNVNPRGSAAQITPPKTSLDAFNEGFASG